MNHSALEHIEHVARRSVAAQLDALDLQQGTPRVTKHELLTDDPDVRDALDGWAPETNS